MEWRLSLVGVHTKFAAIVSVVAHEPRAPDVYRKRLREHEELVHVTIETQHGREDPEALR